MKKKIDFELLKIIISALLFIVSFMFINIKIVNGLLLIISYVLVSYEVYFNAVKNLFKGEIFDENFLMIIATIAAFGINEYSEAVIVILLFQLGEYLSDVAVDNSKDSISNLLELRSDVVNAKIGDSIVIKDTKEIKEGDVFIVKPGEKIPLDGVVIDGKSSIDTSNLTGESLPIDVKVDDIVLSGSVNINGVLTIKSTCEYATSTANRIIELIETSSDKKTKTEKFITKFSKIYTPIIVLLAIIVAIVPPLCFNESFTTWLYRAIELLVISCPCALVISVPLASFCGIGKASKEGILVKGSLELESLAKIKTIVFDKTGTLTKGNFEVSNIVSLSKYSKDAILEIAAYGEFYSNHPIAKSILKKYDKNIAEERISSYKEFFGLGVNCLIYDKEILIGNKDLLINNDINVNNQDVEINNVIYISIDKVCIGYLVIEDVVKKEAINIGEKLKNIGVNRSVILSGDRLEIVKKVADITKIDEYYSNLLPIDKVNKIEEIKSNQYSAFIGDGINDAPVIKVADVGIAMGGIGSDATIEASDIVLMNDNINNIFKAIKLSKITNNIVVFNVVFAITIKLLIMILSIVGIANIWLAVFADVGVTILLVFNSLAILKRKL